MDSAPIRLRATRLPDGVAEGAGRPTELQERLRILVHVALGAFAAVGILAWLIPLLWPPPSEMTTAMGLLAVNVAVICGGMLVLLRSPRSETALRLLGSGFAVLVAAVMAVTEMTLAPQIASGRWGISGIGIWIVLFPLVYPAGIRWTVIAALACASTVPLVYAAGRLLGLPGEGAERLVPWVLPLYFCAGLSVVAASSIDRYRAALAAVQRELRAFGRYELVRRLGRGGMGEVWLARHRLLPRSAAIKFITPPAGAGAEVVADLTRRFEAEATAIARLSSTHTVTLYDFGVGDDGAWYAVMELLDGVDLQQAVEAHGPFPDWRVAGILAQACLSLAEAHAHGLIHRDIKPGNLMLCRQGGELDVVKVLDFGLVSLGQGSGGQPSGVVSTWAGSAGYVAPEVMLAGDIDHRADLYALGCVAWFLLTGRTVFSSADGVQEECVRHCTEPLPPDLHHGGHDPGLVALVHALLAKRRDERPAGADEVRQRLRLLACAQRDGEGDVAAWWAGVTASADATPARPTSGRIAVP